MGIFRYIIRRLMFSVALVFGVSLIIFFIINAIGNPIEILLAERPGITPEAIEAMNRYYGLDQPAPTRYAIWLWNILHLDFGTSIIYNQPVGGMLAAWGWETLKIQVPAILLALALATFIAITAATRQYSRVDFGVMTGALLGHSLPGFFVGIILILVFSYWLGWFPSYGAYSTRNALWNSALADSIWHMVLPIAMLAFFNTATLRQRPAGAQGRLRSRAAQCFHPRPDLSRNPVRVDARYRAGDGDRLHLARSRLPLHYGDPAARLSDHHGREHGDHHHAGRRHPPD